MKSTLLRVVFSLFIGISPAIGWAETGNGAKKDQLDALQKRIRSVQSELEALENKKNSVRAELRDNERLYGSLSSALKRLNDEIGEQEKRLQSVRKERDLNQREIDRLRSFLVRQIRATHAMGRQERLQLILNQDDPFKVSRLLSYYDYLNNARVEQLGRFRSILDDLSASEQELLAGGERLKRLQQDKQAEVKSLEESRKARQLLLAKLDRDYRDRNTELKQLQQDERQLQRLIHRVQQAAVEVPFESGPGKPFSRLRGRMRWPVKGKLIQDYGSRTAAGRSNGVLISAQEGDAVRAVSDGRVVYADWLVRYGLLMIVDHGMGFMTLYAFNQSLYKSVGETVKAGEQIATVGRSGGRSMPALYFEVRKNGKPVNPKKWCVKTRRGNVG